MRRDGEDGAYIFKTWKDEEKRNSKADDGEYIPSRLGKSHDASLK
jgi:hypothetical protein